MSREQESLGRKITIVAVTVLLLPIILPLALPLVILYWIHRLLVYLLVWCIWLPKGKDALVIYSDSPIWRDYMLQEIIPLVGRRAVVINWSERSKWPRWSLVVHVFRSFRGQREFNPMVVIFRPFRSAVVFRFWSAFKSWKYGQTAEVDSLRRELALHL